jgi:hypothetical protein
MRIEVYDGNLAPTNVLDRQVAKASDFLAAQHIDIVYPVSVIAHRCPQPGVEAAYHGFYTIYDKPTHVVSMHEPPNIFSRAEPKYFAFHDTAGPLGHELIHVVQAELGKRQKPKKHNPLLGRTGDDFVRKQISEAQSAGYILTLADVVSDGVAMFAETKYIKSSKGTIFDGIMKRKILADQHEEIRNSMRVLYPQSGTPTITDRVEVDGYAIGYQMMRRFGKVWSHADKNMGKGDYLLSQMVRFDLRKCQHVPVLAHRGGINPEFLHFYYHPEDLPVVPLSTQPSTST